MSDYEICLLAERAQRDLYRRKILEWERANGLTLMPMKLDVKRPRIEQMVDNMVSKKIGGHSNG